MQEIWKDIMGYEGLYQVSNLGKVRSLSHYARSGQGIRIYEGKQMKLIIHRDGYYRINLSKDGIKKNFQVHRLVASAFIPNPKKLSQVNHKDENKLNNYFRKFRMVYSQI